MRPRRGLNVDRTIEQIRHLIVAGDNVRSASISANRARASYLIWVHDVERTLVALFAGVRLERLHTARYWRIHSGLLSDADRPFELISDEIELQRSWLQALLDRLAEESSRASHAGSTLAVTDTNALLHYRLFDEVPWPEIVSATPVRLLVPLRVVDELDAKKASRRRDLADRAATILVHLEQYIGTEMGTPRALRDGVTIEVFRAFEFDPELRPEVAADTEILETCEAAAVLSGGPGCAGHGRYWNASSSHRMGDQRRAHAGEAADSVTVRDLATRAECGLRDKRCRLGAPVCAAGVDLDGL